MTYSRVRAVWFAAGMAVSLAGALPAFWVPGCRAGVVAGLHDLDDLIRSGHSRRSQLFRRFNELDHQLRILCAERDLSGPDMREYHDDAFERTFRELLAVQDAFHASIFGSYKRERDRKNPDYGSGLGYDAAGRGNDK